jgi:hypothetical protein
VVDEAAVSRLVGAHPDEFGGLYVDGDGVVVVVFAPGGDDVLWWPRLVRAAGGRPMRRVRGVVSAAELARVLARLRDFDWPSGRPEYGAVVDPRRGAVVVQVESLPENDKTALVRRFGALVLVDEGYRPDRR